MTSVEYISKHTQKSLPDKIFDYILYTEIDISNFLKQNNDGVIFFTDSSYDRVNLVGTYFSFEDIRRFLFDSEYWSYECPSGIAIERVLNTDAIRLERRYVKIPINTSNDWESLVGKDEAKRNYIPVSINIYVQYSMLYMIFVNRAKTAFLKYERTAQYSANHSFLISALSGRTPISTAHCQSGTNIDVYTVILDLPLDVMQSSMRAFEFFLNYLNFSLGNNDSNDGVVTAPVYSYDPFSQPIRPFVARRLFSDSPVSSERSTPTIQSRLSPRDITSPIYLDNDELMQTPTRIVTPTITRTPPIMRTPTILRTSTVQPRSPPPRQEISLLDLLMGNEDAYPEI